MKIYLTCHVQILQHLLVSFWFIHLEVRKKLPAAGNFCKESTTSGIVFLVFLEVLCDLIDFFGKNTDLHLWGARIGLVRLKLEDQFFLRSFLESHRIGGEKEEAQKTIRRASSSS